MSISVSFLFSVLFRRKKEIEYSRCVLNRLGHSSPAFYCLFWDRRTIAALLAYGLNQSDC